LRARIINTSAADHASPPHNADGSAQVSEPFWGHRLDNPTDSWHGPCRDSWPLGGYNPGRLKRLVASFRGWLVPLGLLALAAIVIVPLTYGILRAAYDRDVDDNVRMLKRRVEVQLGGIGPWAATPQDVVDTLRSEVLSDERVQGVCVFDFSRGAVFPVHRPGVKVPLRVEDIDATLFADPGSMRLRLPWTYDLERLAAQLSRQQGRTVSPAEARQQLIKAGARADMLRGFIYLDLSQTRLQQHFWQRNGPLLKRVGVFTAAALIAASALGTLAYRAIQKLSRVRQRAEWAQQGLLAERGLTAAVLAHEIRNPLAALRFQVHSLRRNHTDAARVSDTCDTINSELLRIQQLVHDYLAHEKAQTMRLADVDLSEAAQSLQTLMEEFLASTQTKLAVQPLVAPVVVACDPHMLRQALMNLVLNAQQAMGRGGTITLTLGREGRFGTLDVSDTGPGIPPEMHERLFKPFQTSRPEGSGIGLALVKRFVDNFGGTVTVKSVLGQGTTFCLRLPLAHATADAAEAAPVLASSNIQPFSAQPPPDDA